jgi:FtsH-binding integral membrane protein
MLRTMFKPVTHSSHRFLGLLMTAAVTLTPAIAAAQSAAPPPALRRAPAVWVGLMIMAVLLAMVLAVSLMPSKRSHQD